LETLKEELADLESEASDDTNAAHDEAIEILNDWKDENGEELKELTDAAGDRSNQEEAHERITEDPLSIEVRGNWREPGNDDNVPTEFQILLCTGGPAVRIMGELNSYREPCRAWIEHQDWGTPWQQAFNVIEQDTLLTYCRQFYFGN
jgi:hypothetical protein